MAQKLPGVYIRNADGGLKKTGSSIGAIAIIGTGATIAMQKKALPVVSATDAKKFGEGSLQRACARIFEMGGAEVIGYAVSDSATDAEYLAGVDALIAEHTQKECIAIVDATDATLWASVITKVNDAVAIDRYLYAVVQTRLAGAEETDSAYASALVTEWGATDGERLAVCAGSIVITGANGTDGRAPIIDTVLGAIAQREAWQNIEAVKYGALKSVKMPDNNWSDEELTSLMNKGYITVRRFYGRTGVYITSARLATTETSDYDILSKIRVMNRVSTIVRDVQLEYVNGNLPANEGGAHLLKKASEMPLQSMKDAGEFTDFSVEVDISKLLTDREISCEVSLVPLGTASVIQSTIKYTVEV